MKRLVVVTTVVLGIALGQGVASAHPVGVPGTPSCFGQRISHGSSDHKLTPKDRAAALALVVASDLVSEEEREAFEQQFGVGPRGVTVQVFTRFVRANCSDNPFIPTPPAPPVP